MSKPYRPLTGRHCGCVKGTQRKNCPRCEGTGWEIDFKKIRLTALGATMKREEATLRIFRPYQLLNPPL